MKNEYSNRIPITLTITFVLVSIFSLFYIFLNIAVLIEDTNDSNVITLYDVYYTTTFYFKIIVCSILLGISYVVIGTAIDEIAENNINKNRFK